MTHNYYNMQDNLQFRKKTKVYKLKWYQYWVPYVVLFVTWLTAHQLIRFFVHMKVLGSANVREAERIAKYYGAGIVFAMNHTSELDPFFATSAATPYYSAYPMFYVTGKMGLYKAHRKGFKTLIYNSAVFKSLGSQYLKSGNKNYAVSLARHINLLKAGRSVCIFPEGKISSDGKIGESHGGLGYLALETGAVVIPITVTGAWGITIRDFFLRKRQVSIHYGGPIHNIDFKPDLSSSKNKYQQYTDMIMKKIESVS